MMHRAQQTAFKMRIFEIRMVDTSLLFYLVNTILENKWMIEIADAGMSNSPDRLAESPRHAIFCRSHYCSHDVRSLSSLDLACYVGTESRMQSRQERIHESEGALAPIIPPYFLVLVRCFESINLKRNSSSQKE